MTGVARAWAIVLVAGLIAAPAAADYPTPAEAGFAHCALIYDRPARTADDLAAYVAYPRTGRPTAWLFDAYLFLIQLTPDRVSTQIGETRRADWQYHLDRWFADGRDLAALDAAVAQAAGALGEPPSPRQVILSIPAPHSAVTDFGDVDGDGASESLATPEGRRKVLDWYITAARERFAAAGYRHLDLWGFYWMNEGVYGDAEETARQTSAMVHDAGLRMLWIPWYRAHGWDRWRTFGFDVGILQPNYAFGSHHLGTVRRNRLAVTAALARQAGMGVEMEAGDLLGRAADRRLFLHYLADGAPERLGYQSAATAWYLATDLVESLASADEPALRGLYDAMAGYILGERVPEPDAPANWTIDGRTAPELADHRLDAARAVTVAEAALRPDSRVGQVDVFLHEPAGAEPWRGWVVVEARDVAGDWQPAGWALRLGADERDAAYQVVTVPIDRAAAALRVTLTGDRPAPVAELGVAPADEGLRPHLALRRPYRVSLAPPAAYPDSGGELTDGVVGGGYPSGHTVGWYGRPVGVTLDLGEIVPVAAVEVSLQGGGAAAVRWPASGLALLGRDHAMPLPAGSGVVPAGMGEAPPLGGWAPLGEVTVDERRAADDADGRAAFALAEPVPARYVTLWLQPDAWLMLYEVRVLTPAGDNAAAGRPYTLLPPPSPKGRGEGYPDDGRRLTDGRVAPGFSPRALTGWTDDEGAVEVDLGAERAVGEVAVWSLGGGGAGIHTPAAASVEVSDDGRTWRPWATAHPPADAPPADLGRAVAVALRATAEPVSARWLRVQLKRGAGWVMLSEIEVLP